MKILIVTTVVSTINAFMIPQIGMFKDMGYEVDIGTNIYNQRMDVLEDLCNNIYDIPFNRSPIKIDNYKAYKEIKKIINSNNYDIIYVHTPIASAITRYACKDRKNTRIIYTAHGFHFYKGAPLKNWVIFYPVEKYLSKYTDTLITINKEDYNSALKKLKAKKTVLINGVGVDLDRIKKVNVDYKKKRKELGINDKDFVILSVGELNDNKNHIEVIRAIKDMDNKHNIKYLICGKGPNKNKLDEYINNNSLTDNVELLGYREDIIEIMKISDVFIFPSKREGLPVSVMEAMACGLPVICSYIRGNKDLIDDGLGGIIVKENIYNEYTNALLNVINEDILRENMGNYNKNKIKSYDIKFILGKMKNIIQ